MEYREFFERNYGIFTDEEQERLRNSSILIIGCGGIGAPVAIMLARSGVSRFILVDYDVFNPSNTNRQICCFTDTMGRKKAQVVRDDIMRINPEASVTAYDRLLDHDEIEGLMKDIDIVFPAADDFAFSLFVFRRARKLGKPALLVVPSGTWAHVSLIPPHGPTPEDLEGVPALASYEELKKTLEIRKFKLGTYFYVPLGDWRIDYYRYFIERAIPPTQLCPTVWLCSAMGAFEIVKHVTGKWRPVEAPRYWHITARSIRLRRMNDLSIMTLLVLQRKIMWRLFQTPLAQALEVFQNAWWRHYYLLMKWVEKRRSKKTPLP